MISLVSASNSEFEIGIDIVSYFGTIHYGWCEGNAGFKTCTLKWHLLLPSAYIVNYDVYYTFSSAMEKYQSGEKADKIVSFLTLNQSCCVEVLGSSTCHILIYKVLLS